MVNHVDTEAFSSDSMSPPPSSSDNRLEVNEVLRFDEIQDTEMIDEAEISLETPFHKLYDDTELVDNEETLGQELVVDDSEDDEDGVNGSVSAIAFDSESKAIDTLLESDGSNDQECQIGKQELSCDVAMTGLQGSSRISDDCRVPGLEYLDSQEPGESTQAEALGFVDNLLMDKDLNMSPVNLRETSWRRNSRKSPPFSSAKGRQSLAKRIKSRSPTRKLSVFDWDSDQCDASDAQNTMCFKRRENHVENDDPGVKEGSMDLLENRKVSTHPAQRFTQNNAAKHHKMELTSSLGQLLNKAPTEKLEPEEDFIDVGINTQIAAEAISALLFAPCTKEEACESEMLDRASNLYGKNSNTIEGSLEGDNGSDLLSAPIKKGNSKYKRKFTMKERTRTNVSAITCLLNLCEWKHPRAKRSCLTQRHHMSPRKSWGAIHHTFSSRLRVSLSWTRQASSCQSGVNDSDVANHKRSCNKDLRRPFRFKEIKRLGGSGKVGDFMWKDLRRRRNLAHVRVLFSQHLDQETIKQQKKIMVRLGISPASSSVDSTHFIAERFSRTRNMLEAIALGKHVVTPLWLESCGQTRCLIDEKNYILKDSKKEKDGFCMLQSLVRAKHHPLLKGLKVCITPNIKPDRGMIADLVKLTQGQVVDVSEIIASEDSKLQDDLLILSCEDDRDLCLPFINQGAEIYTSELLLNGIVIQKLEYARHCLF